MKVWVVTGTDIDGADVYSSKHTLEDFRDKFADIYEVDDIEMTENYLRVGDYWVEVNEQEVIDL